MSFVLIDTFPEFESFWAEARAWPPAAQIDGWATRYLAPWPELLHKQQADYAGQGLDWRQVAGERVFPFLDERLPAMAQARQAVLASLEVMERQVGEHPELGLDFDVGVVIYVGIGCGAGWATGYGGGPACLFGLEALAECGWTWPKPVAELFAHELGHLVHQRWRVQAGLASGEGDPLWPVYEEGFAQRFGHLMVGYDSWHQQVGHEGWLAWCQANRSRLAAQLLAAVDENRPLTPFFGSWYNIEGHSECGYFLGHEIIAAWQAALHMREIALLPWPDGRSTVRAALVAMAGAAGREDDA